MKQVFSTKDLSELKALAQQMAQAVKPSTVILLRGPLGSGKTQWVKFFLAALGGEEALSPSFSLENIYKTSDFEVHHFDLYRLEGESEIESCGLWDAFSDPAVVIVEWADRLGEVGFPPRWKVWHLSFLGHQQVEWDT